MLDIRSVFPRYSIVHGGQMVAKTTIRSERESEDSTESILIAPVACVCKGSNLALKYLDTVKATANIE